LSYVSTKKFHYESKAAASFWLLVACRNILFTTLIYVLMEHRSVMIIMMVYDKFSLLFG